MRVVDEDEVFRQLATAVRRHPGVASLFDDGNRAVLIFDGAGERLLAHSRGAAALASRARAGVLAPRQIAALASRPPATGATRLERLALDGGRLAPPSLCACAAFETAEGAPALLIALLDPLPRRGVEAPAVAAPEPDAPEVPADEPPVPAPPLRFVWSSDAEGRLNRVSESLAQAVGAGDVGRRWADLLGSRIIDPDDRLVSVLARQETFRAVPVSWRIAQTAEALSARLSGVPQRDAGRRFSGFAGFGLVEAGQRHAIAPLPALRVAAPDPALPALVAEPAAEAPVPQERRPVRQPVSSLELAGRTMADFAEIVAAPLTTLGLTWGFGFPASPPSEKASPAPAKDGDGGEPAEASKAEPDPIPPADPPAPVEAAPPADLTSPRETVPSDPPDGRGETVLSFNEHAAFREIALALAGRFGGNGEEREAAPVAAQAGYGEVTPFPVHAVSRRPVAEASEDPVRRVLDRLPVGILVLRGERLLFANRHLLDLVSSPDAAAIEAGGGVGALLSGAPVEGLGDGDPSPVRLVGPGGAARPAEASSGALEWEGAPARLILLRPVAEVDPAQNLAAAELILERREARLREVAAVLDTVPDGVITLDGADRIIGFNRGAQTLFGHDPREITGEQVSVLAVPADRAGLLAFLGRVRRAGVQEGADFEVLGRGRQGADMPLAVTATPLSGEPRERLSVVLRDVSAFRRAEIELKRARRAAETVSARKTDILVAVGRELRPSLNAIVEHAGGILEERHGALGSERYRDDLRAIQVAGGRAIRLVTDLVDLARIEAGRVALGFAGVALNDLVAHCVGELQPDAARARIVMRTSFAAHLPAVLADAETLRRAVTNLVSNAIRFTDPGGQVIVSTALTDAGEAVLRVRDTGRGMTPDEIEAALRPFGAGTEKRSGAGLGLPLTKALVEANRGALQVTSGKGEGALMEVLFPADRILRA